MKTTSRLAMVAAAGLMMGGFALSAKAADLGGDCCADLEERVAELEATTARKGNRKVSLGISGQVNRALLIWDDGVDSDAYIVDNNTSSTRFRFKGSATMKPGWKAGFLIEIQLADATSGGVKQSDDEAASEDGKISIRHANWYIESEKYGRITLGQGSSATDDLTTINLGGSISDAALYWNNSFSLRTPGAGFSKLTWGDLATGQDDSNRADFIRYDTPSIYGFILSAAWGENDVWDAALRFQKEWNSIRVAAGIGYYWSGEDPAASSVNFKGDDVEEIEGSFSVMHVPSGVYFSFAAGQRDRERTFTKSDNLSVVVDDEATFFYGQLGITKKFTSYGATTLYAEYGQYNDYAAGLNAGGFSSGDVTLDDDVITGSEVERFGFGVTQAFDSAALELYAQFHYYQAELDVSDTDVRELVPPSVSVDAEDWYTGVVGARIKF